MRPHWLSQLFACSVGLIACGQSKQDTPTPQPTPKPSQAPINQRQTPSAELPPTTEATTLAVAAVETTPLEGAEITVAFNAIDLPSQDELTLSKITLKLQEPNKAPIIKELGEFPGCTDEPGEDKVLGSIRCFWSGGEDLFELVQEDAALIVRHTLIDDNEETPIKPEDRLRFTLTKNTKIKLHHPGENLEISADRVGPYRLTMTAKEVSALPHATPQGEDVFSFDQDGLEIFLKQPLNVVCGIAINSPGPKTKDGLGVGSTVGDFQRAYGSMKWAQSFSALQLEREPNLLIAVSFEEVGREHKLPRPEAKVTALIVGDCEAAH